jgi:hypothetical protein
LVASTTNHTPAINAPFAKPDYFLFNLLRLQTHSILVFPMIQEHNHHNLIQLVKPKHNFFLRALFQFDPIIN